ncbi:MAG: hypothetical protein RBR40_06500 [Tenuifilaceae bacterium]|jgi:hypothetical protein|nr:hypothetical protein [Tenuifilaceae bacterium]
MTKQEVIKSFIDKAQLKKLEALVANVGELPVDVLPMLRKFDLNSIQDAIVQADFQVDMFNNETPVVAQAWNYRGEDDYCETVENCIGGHEPDEVQFMIRFKTGYFKPEYREVDKTDTKALYVYLATIMLSDCTGCCDALEFGTLTKYGILIGGDVSMTFHS